MKTQVNEIKITYQGGIRAEEWKKINGSQSAAKLIYEDWDKGTIGLFECFKVVLMNNGNRVKGIYQISQGGITGTLVDLRILFAVMLKSLSVALIVCHNHPSGTMRASRSDIELTERIKRAAELFDIKLLDHLIIAPDGSYYSFSDNGLL